MICYLTSSRSTPGVPTSTACSRSHTGSTCPPCVRESLRFSFDLQPTSYDVLAIRCRRPIQALTRPTVKDQNHECGASVTALPPHRTA